MLKRGTASMNVVDFLCATTSVLCVFGLFTSAFAQQELHKFRIVDYITEEGVIGSIEILNENGSIVRKIQSDATGYVAIEASTCKLGVRYRASGSLTSAAEVDCTQVPVPPPEYEFKVVGIFSAYSQLPNDKFAPVGSTGRGWEFPESGILDLRSSDIGGLIVEYESSMVSGNFGASASLANEIASSSFWNTPDGSVEVFSKKFFSVKAAELGFMAIGFVPGKPSEPLIVAYPAGLAANELAKLEVSLSNSGQFVVERFQESTNIEVTGQWDEPAFDRAARVVLDYSTVFEPTLQPQPSSGSQVRVPDLPLKLLSPEEIQSRRLDEVFRFEGVSELNPR